MAVLREVHAACWPSRMVVLREVHAAWKSARTLCIVCAGFHVMHIHEIGEEEKTSIPCIICMCSFLKEGRGEKRLVFVSKKIISIDG